MDDNNNLPVPKIDLIIIIIVSLIAGCLLTFLSFYFGVLVAIENFNNWEAMSAIGTVVGAFATITVPGVLGVWTYNKSTNDKAELNRKINSDNVQIEEKRIYKEDTNSILKSYKKILAPKVKEYRDYSKDDIYKVIFKDDPNFIYDVMRSLSEFNNEAKSTIFKDRVQILYNMFDLMFQLYCWMNPYGTPQNISYQPAYEIMYSLEQLYGNIIDEDSYKWTIKRLREQTESWKSILRNGRDK